MGEIRIGTVEHYYPKAHAAVVRIEKGVLHLGDQIHVAGDRDDFWEEVTSMQVDHEPIEVAHKGESIGLQVEQPVHAGAEVYKLDALEV